MGDDTAKEEPQESNTSDEDSCFLESIKNAIQEHLNKLKEKDDELTSDLPACPDWLKYLIMAILSLAIGYYIYTHFNL